MSNFSELIKSEFIPNKYDEMARLFYRVNETANLVLEDFETTIDKINDVLDKESILEKSYENEISLNSIDTLMNTVKTIQLNSNLLEEHGDFEERVYELLEKFASVTNFSDNYLDTVEKYIYDIDNRYVFNDVIVYEKILNSYDEVRAKLVELISSHKLLSNPSKLINKEHRNQLINELNQLKNYCFHENQKYDAGINNKIQEYKQNAQLAKHGINYYANNHIQGGVGRNITKIAASSATWAFVESEKDNLMRQVNEHLLPIFKDHLWKIESKYFDCFYETLQVELAEEIINNKTQDGVILFELAKFERIGQICENILEKSSSIVDVTKKNSINNFVLESYPVNLNTYFSNIIELEKKIYNFTKMSFHLNQSEEYKANIQKIENLALSILEESIGENYDHQRVEKSLEFINWFCQKNFMDDVVEVKASLSILELIDSSDYKNIEIVMSRITKKISENTNHYNDQIIKKVNNIAHKTYNNFLYNSIEKKNKSLIITELNKFCKENKFITPSIKKDVEFEYYLVSKDTFSTDDKIDFLINIYQNQQLLDNTENSALFFNNKQIEFIEKECRNIYMYYLSQLNDKNIKKCETSFWFLTLEFKIKAELQLFEEIVDSIDFTQKLQKLNNLYNTLKKCERINLLVYEEKNKVIQYIKDEYLSLILYNFEKIENKEINLSELREYFKKNFTEDIKEYIADSEYQYILSSRYTLDQKLQLLPSIIDEHKFDSKYAYLAQSILYEEYLNNKDVLLQERSTEWSMWDDDVRLDVEYRKFQTLLTVSDEKMSNTHRKTKVSLYESYLSNYENINMPYDGFVLNSQKFTKKIGLNHKEIDSFVNIEIEKYGVPINQDKHLSNYQIQQALKTISKKDVSDYQKELLFWQLSQMTNSKDYNKFIESYFKIIGNDNVYHFLKRTNSHIISDPCDYMAIVRIIKKNISDNFNDATFSVLDYFKFNDVEKIAKKESLLPYLENDEFYIAYFENRSFWRGKKAIYFFTNKRIISILKNKIVDERPYKNIMTLTLELNEGDQKNIYLNKGIGEFELAIGFSRLGDKFNQNIFSSFLKQFFAIMRFSWIIKDSYFIEFKDGTIDSIEQNKLEKLNRYYENEKIMLYKYNSTQKEWFVLSDYNGKWNEKVGLEKYYVWFENEISGYFSKYEIEDIYQNNIKESDSNKLYVYDNLNKQWIEPDFLSN